MFHKHISSYFVIYRHLVIYIQTCVAGTKNMFLLSSFHTFVIVYSYFFQGIEANITVTGGLVLLQCILHTYSISLFCNCD